MGVGLLGTFLEQHGHEVRVFDQNVEGLEDEGLWQLVAEFQPDIAGFSVITPNYPVARQQIRRLKQLHPEVRVVAGGIHATLFPEDLIADGADVVVLGEGEPVILELVAGMAEGRDLGGLPGLLFRARAGEVIRTEGRCRAPAWMRLPLVDRSLYNLPKYTHHSMLASRGCPHHCAFCCNYTGTVRSRRRGRPQAPGSASRKWSTCATRMARTRFFLRTTFSCCAKRTSWSFAMPAPPGESASTGLAKCGRTAWTQAVAQAMRAAECVRIYLGVESGSDLILREAKKGMTTAQIRRGMRAALEAGLRVKTGWIYGLPGSLEEQYKSIPFMLDLRPHEISIHQLIPFPGTIYYSDPSRFGIRIADPKAFESFCYGGLEGGIRFDYLSHGQLRQLLEDTATALEAAGYVSSDNAGPGAEYIYTTPLCRHSMNVFRPTAPVLAA